MKTVSILVFCLLLLSSCGKNTQTASGRDLAQAQANLDHKDYGSAISLLEGLKEANPHNQEIQVKLFHAYAGASGFEAIKMAQIVVQIEKSMKELEKNKVQGFESYFKKWEEILAIVPQIGPKQEKRLNQAIHLYQKLEFHSLESSKYNNFKWGTIHIYRLALTIKSLNKELKNLIGDLEEGQFDQGKIEELIWPKLKRLGHDLLMFYRLYSHSFDRLKQITEGLSNRFHLKLNNDAKDEEEFLQFFIRDNGDDIIKMLLKKSAT